MKSIQLRRSALAITAALAVAAALSGTAAAGGPRLLQSGNLDQVQLSHFRLILQAHCPPKTRPKLHIQ